MNNLWSAILKESKNKKMKAVEQEISYLNEEPIDAKVECPFCHYQSKRGAVSGKIFEDKQDHSKAFKCFNCGIWRKLK